MKIVGYRTENLINGHYYYGVRTLRKENDSYLGSGLRLKAAITKYGRKNFKRVDLFEFQNFQEALKWEKTVITAETIEDPKCYNLKPGGAGGSPPWTEEKKQRMREQGSYKKTDTVKQKLSEAALKRFKSEPGTFTGRKHSDETLAKLRESHIGRPSKNKGKKLNLSAERLEQLRKPKSKVVKDKISRALCQLSDEQVRFLKEDFKDVFGARTQLSREWGINLDQISRVIGTRYTNIRTKSKN